MTMYSSYLELTFNDNDFWIEMDFLAEIIISAMEMYGAEEIYNNVDDFTEVINNLFYNLILMRAKMLKSEVLESIDPNHFRIKIKLVTEDEFKWNNGETIYVPLAGNPRGRRAFFKY